MSYNSWVQTLPAVQQIDGTALTASTAQTSILPGAAKFNLPANLLQIGTCMGFRAAGRMSNVVTTPGTLTFELKFGSVVVWTSGAIALNIVAETNGAWILDIDLICRSIGNSTTATMWGIGDFCSRSIIGSATAAAGSTGNVLLPYTSPTTGTGFDSTVSNVIDLFATWSISNANSIRCDAWIPLLRN